MTEGRSTASEAAFAWQPLRRGADFTLYRGVEKGSRKPLLGVTTAASHPPVRLADQLRHELALASKIDVGWAARPLAIERHEGREILVLDDPGGLPLDMLIERRRGAPLDVDAFLHAAISLAEAVGAVHRQGLIHKDVKPANVLMREDGRSFLMGFGLASELPRQRSSPKPPNTVAGTPAYMSPEQTGRVSRVLDARSDLYSLGVTLYELLTTRLPFHAADPIEWVHCHVARKPQDLATVVPDVPDVVRSIVMKLLVKPAEGRYGSAEGLASDLRRCRDHRTADGAIAAFPLGLHDRPDHMILPENLYGRGDERAEMISCLDRIKAGGRPELILVSGGAGVGKTSLVRDVFGVSRCEDVLFAEGKFDQHALDVPFASLSQAFDNPIRRILSGSAEDLARWHVLLEEALGSNARLVIDLIPELELIIGPRPGLPELPAHQSRDRFSSVMRRFVEVFTKGDRPLVLFFDDLQWADRPTLDLINDVLGSGETRGLLVVGCHRGRALDDDRWSEAMVARLRAQATTVLEIELYNLSGVALNHLIGDALRCDLEVARPLADVIHGKTGGNPLFATQFLQALEDEGLLWFGSPDARWAWDLDRIRARHHSENVVDLLVAQIDRLGPETGLALRQLACIDGDADVSLLADACGWSEGSLHERLREALADGIVIYADERYAFEHDRLRNAAYSLMSDDDRTATHLKIGRQLRARFHEQDRDGQIFQTVGQFNRGRRLLHSSEERLEVAGLNLTAARRAKNATAYSSAIAYLDLVDELQPDDRWNVDHSTSFESQIVRSECEMLTGGLDAAERRLAALGPRATTISEEASVTCLQIDLGVVRARPHLALEVGLTFLEKLGYVANRVPSKDEVRQAFRKVVDSLEGRPVQSLSEISSSGDANANAAVDVLNRLVLSALYRDPRLHQLLIALMVQISLENGNNAASAFGYVSFGRVLITEFSDFSTALQFGRLALDLVDRNGLDAFKGRVYFNFGTGISSWSRPLREGLSYIRMALEEARRNGDLPYIGYCHSNIVGNLLSSGAPLTDVDEAAIGGLDFAIASGSRIAAAFLMGQLRLIRSLRGKPCDLIDPDGLPFDPDAYEALLGEASEPDVVADMYWSRRLQALVFQGDFDAAREAAVRPRTMSMAPWPNIEAAEYHFYAGLASAGIGVERLAEIKEHHRQLEEWSIYSPDNLQCRAVLLLAEIARLEGRSEEAGLLYDKAVQSARTAGFVQIEALAWENAARLYRGRGLNEIAGFHLDKAREGYERWGASGVVRRLGVASSSLEPSPSDRQFDVNAVLNASQALSGEMRQPELIDKLMRIVVEHAGADRAVLTLAHEGDQHIVAEARAQGADLHVIQRQSEIQPRDLPQSVFRYATRTGQRVILDDAATDEIHSTDEYVLLNKPRSMVCMPLAKQGSAVGVLYLENSLTPGAFTDERLVVLDLIASQAAISLENARLFSDLQRSETFLSQGQMISRTGSFGWSVTSGDFFWSKELYGILEYEPSVPPSAERAMERIHPEDRERVGRVVERAMARGRDFDSEHRLLLPDGRVKFVHTIGRSTNAENLDFVGSVRDVTDRVHAEEALRDVRNDLAHVARVTTLNAMAASIAHEVNQPLSGILTNANAGMRFLTVSPPDIAATTETLRRTIRDAKRASDVVQRLRAMFQRQPATFEEVDLNEAAQEVAALLGGEITKARAVLQTSYAERLPPIKADRVQLQQVILNLLMNGIEAMATVSERPKSIILRTTLEAEGNVRLDVQDAGTGLDPDAKAKLFEPFFTTKGTGLGIGLSICRSIIEGLDGRLWASSNDGPGTTFSFTIPAATKK